MESVSFDDASALVICVNSKALFYRKQFYINIYWNKKKSKKKQKKQLKVLLSHRY